jgi:hypothetical protein
VPEESIVLFLRITKKLEEPTGCATSCKQASDRGIKYGKEIAKSRQRFLALMTGVRGEKAHDRKNFLVCQFLLS